MSKNTNCQTLRPPRAVTSLNWLWSCRTAVHWLVLGVLAGMVGAESATTTAAAPEQNSALSASAVAGSVLLAMDPSADPCQDFYRYACGGWLDAERIPEDQTRWARSFTVVRERNRQLIRELLEGAAQDPGESVNRQRVGTFYRACLDEAAVEQTGLGPLAPWLAEIAAVSDLPALLSLTGKLHRIGSEVLFSFSVFPDFKDPERNIANLAQGGLGLPDRDDYASATPAQQQLRMDYEQHVARMLGWFGTSPEQAQLEASQILAFETQLAQASRSQVEMRDFERLYHKRDRVGLEQLTPQLPWEAYFRAIGYPKIVDINLLTPEFFTALEKTLLANDLAAVRAYLRWHLIRATAELLPQAVVDADFAFYGTRLSGQKVLEPRWKRCVQTTESLLAEAVGELYVERAFAGPSKDVALTMVHDVETAFAANLPGISWMDDATRERAREKLHGVGNRIGYPDKWRDFSQLELQPGKYFHNTLAARGFDFDDRAGKVGQPVDRGEWSMPPQEVNAYYNPSANDMTFPAGILQPPFFHRDFPAAMNYGGIGSAVGHELTHGFDDQGRKFDPHGRLQEWWDPAVSQRFEERARCVQEQYDAYEIEPGLKLNGQLTLGENIADIGGVKTAIQAFKLWEKRQAEPSPSAIPGLTNEQLFFVAYGQVWCALIRPETARLRAKTDPHSPSRFRVNGTVANVAEFAAAFGCAAGTPMRPHNICEVW